MNKLIKFVLFSGIDEEEVEEMEANVPVPPPEAKVGLPQDFQDALSIIFDKNSGKVAAPKPVAPPVNDSNSNTVDATDTNAVSYNDESNTSEMELDEQSQYMLYGSMTDKPLIFNDNKIMTEGLIEMNSMILTENIPTPPVKILDANGKLTEMPSSLDGTESQTAMKNDINQMSLEAQQKRQQELDDLAMLGIDTNDLAAQCI